MSSVPDSTRPPRDAARTRERILDAAQALILDHGYAATTVEMVVGQAGITKGAFFHHFASKAELARALVDRYARADRELLQHNLERAKKLASDPLQQVLVLIGLYEELFETFEQPFPGCLFASYIYEQRLFEDATVEVLKEATLLWRNTMKGMLAKVVAAHPPRIPVDLESLADLFYVMTEGSFVMTKTLSDRTLLFRHSKHLRNYLELLFGPAPATPQAPS